MDKNKSIQKRLERNAIGPGIGYGTDADTPKISRGWEVEAIIEPPRPLWGLVPCSRNWSDPSPWTRVYKHPFWQPKIADKKCITILRTGSAATSYHEIKKKQFRSRSKKRKFGRKKNKLSRKKH